MNELSLKSLDKFVDPRLTADGQERASVELGSLKTLWFNTGSVCNLSCENCYIESNPQNDRLAYLTTGNVASYFKEIKMLKLPTKLIGFTGGEPFLNPDFLSILQLTLENGFDTLVLTNGFRRIERYKKELQALNRCFGEKLQIRISLDHYSPSIHEKERGGRTFGPTLKTAKWLFDQGFRLSIAGRAIESESQSEAVQGYQTLFKKYEIGLNANSSEHLVVFPEMDLDKDVPEITVDCWGILKKEPEQQMCASERMIVKHKGNINPSVMPCTLLAYDPQFNLGSTLNSARKTVPLNHKFCAQFCVLGGASCSSTA
ncbi:MAG TPA: radical SAM protein [Gammaproteobacteria bacterium]|nr:radical SAM protein [Gammaproteobacteria bacterium]|tara:strand:- start:372 stop:1319 length:948 start_codon:yes stop_codon:yes gene_type:complete